MAKSYDKNCRHCGKPFVTLSAHGAYCSVNCRNKAARERQQAKQPPKAPVQRRCQACDEAFEPQSSTQKFCTPRCQKIWWRLERLHRRNEKKSARSAANTLMQDFILGRYL